MGRHAGVKFCICGWSLDVLPRYFTLEDYEGGVARELRGPALTEANLVSAAVGIADVQEAALA